jgi:hypothetical protein
MKIDQQISLENARAKIRLDILAAARRPINPLEHIDSPFMRDERRRIIRQRIYVVSLMLLSFAVGIVFTLIAGGCR